MSEADSLETVNAPEPVYTQFLWVPRVVSMALPSPTLTNPDMILPNNPPSAASSPSTPRRSQRLPPPSPSEYQHPTSDSALDDRSRERGTMFSPFKNDILRRHDGSTKHTSNSEKDDGGTTRTDEPALLSSSTLQRDHGDLGENGKAEDDAQGDDQIETRKSTYSPPSILDEDEEDPSSHAAMTKRAEEILANAKKRLTNMEGNLTRARSTLERRPISSMSSPLNREPVSLYALPRKGRSPGGFSPAKHRQANPPMPDENQQGHQRVFSETSVPSTLQTTPNGLSMEDSNQYPHVGDPATKDRNSEPSRNWFWNGLTRTTSLNHVARQNNGLQSLDEDGPAPESFEQSSQTNEFRDDETFDLETPSKAAAVEPPTPPTTELTRARSTTQMRDLRDQMQDLKGKISTLKQRAKEDNLRRRSLQSLRTPSPFTAAEPWQPIAEVGESSAENFGLAEETKEFDAEKTPNEAAPEVIEQTLAATEEDGTKHDGESGAEQSSPKPTSQKEDPVRRPSPTESESITYLKSPRESPAERLIIVDELSSVDLDREEDSIYEEDYHESSAEPVVVERHEDRPDAFDYEHFILHSAMGSYSGVGVRRSSSMRKRRASESSASSVETTKPRDQTNEINGYVTNGNESSSSGGHVRKDSVESVSTINTFATATEGKSLAPSDDDEDDDWTPRHTMAGSWQPEPKKHKVNGIHGSPKSKSKKHIASAYKSPKNDAKPYERKASPTHPPDLISYIISIADPDSPLQSETVEPLQIGDRDRELIERLIGSLAKVCANLHKLGVEGAVYDARVCRRKLDSARRMLDGEVNGEAF